MTKLTKKGFTLIEMLIVIVIIGILAGVLLPKIGGAKDKANDVAVTANVKNLGTAIIQYEMDNNKYPENRSGTEQGLKAFADTTIAEKYGVSISSGDLVATKYDYYTSGNHFIICGKYSNGNNAGNSSNLMSGDELKLKEKWTYQALGSEGNWYCYQS